MKCVPASERPKRVAAMDALLRRLDDARRDELRVESRPENGRLLGLYGTRRKGTSSARPYQTVVRGVDPIEAYCDRPGFVENSLGVCKHVLAVLATLHKKPKRLEQALSEQREGEGTHRNGLQWDPDRPIQGAGDWLERVFWLGSQPSGRALSVRRTRALGRFKCEGETDRWILTRTYADQPQRRFELVDDIRSLMPARNGKADSTDPALSSLLDAERERLAHIVANAVRPAEARSILKSLKRSL